MCCFSRPVNSVAATRIFARFTAPGVQAVIYQMRLDASEDLAMILPLPVAQPAGDRAVTFVNLEKYDAIFRDLERGFPPPPASRGRSDSFGLPLSDAKPLKVHSVGAYEASFVPNTNSFTRLDERFRLPAGVWDSLPQYADYGFAVFKLKKGRSRVHPMAFTFPSARRSELFFPTVHIHDGKVHPTERFDHILYAQAGPDSLVPKWRESELPASRFVDTDRGKGLLDGGTHVYRHSLHGRLENKDTLVRPRRFGG